MADRSDRICIIGGGPAGLSAGMYLEKKGYDAYTILERNDHVGGKCHSPYYGGRRYEMGAIMGVPSYYAVHDVEEFCGITHDGPKLSRSYRDSSGCVVRPFEPGENSGRLPRLMQMKDQLRELCRLLETKYMGYDVNGHRGVSMGRYEGCRAAPGREPVSGDNPHLKDLCLPFAVFCEMNGIGLIQDIWIEPFTSFGYGYFDEIPAAYVLKYLDFQTAMNFVKSNLWTWKEGTQYIWEQLNSRLKNPARLNCDITKVERKDGRIFVTVNGETGEYDKIIVTSPLQDLPDYFDADEDEIRLFSKIICESYEVMAVETKPEDHPGTSYFVFENMTPERRGHLMACYRRWSEDRDQVITTYAIRNHTGDPEISRDSCRAAVLEDLSRMKTPASEVVNEQSWRCFPHVDSETYAAGWYEEVEGMQGRNGTYYAGEVMSFADMDETAEYSRELVDRFF